MFDHVSSRIAVVVALVVASASAQSWPVGLTSTLQFTVPAVGPAHLGGLTFNASGNQLLLVGAADSPVAAAYSYTPVRNPGTSRITGLSAGTAFAPTPNADSGLELNGGLLFFSRYGDHQVGQYNPVTMTSYAASLPSSFASTGGLTFIPAGYPNAGTLLVSSYSHGDIYSMPLVPAGNGFFNVGTATLYANMPFAGTEGIKFVTSGPLAGHLLVANYSYGRLDAVSINASTGLPVGGAASPTVIPVVTQMPYIEGLGIDPVTGDLFISSYGAGTLYRVDGFQTFTALASDHPSFSVGGGAAVNLYVRAGTIHANRAYALVASASGTAPGTPLAPGVTLPLNVDPITNFVVANLNTPLFTNFLGTLNTKGSAIATFNVPPIALGGPFGLDFAAALLSPVDFATNAVHVTLLP
jgi:hypothetical protein